MMTRTIACTGARALALVVVACGPGPSQSSATETGASSTGSGGDEPVSCEIEGEPACADCFLLLAAFDRWTANVDIWYAFDGETMVEFDPPDGDHSEVAVTADHVGVAVHLPWFATEMQYSTFKDGAWNETQPIGFDGQVASLAGDGRCVHMLYDDADDQRRHAIFDGTSWHAGEALPVAPGGGNGRLAARDGELVHVFVDESGALTSVARTATWQAPQVLGEGLDLWTPPSIAALPAGAEFIVVHGGSYTTREAGEWAPLAAIPGMDSIRYATVTALRDGRAAVVWVRSEGLDIFQHFYSMYDPAARTWTPPVEYPGGRVTRPLYVTAGAEGQEFFLAYTWDPIGGTTTTLARLDGPDFDLLEQTIFEQDIGLASNP